MTSEETLDRKAKVDSGSVLPRWTRKTEDVAGDEEEVFRLLTVRQLMWRKFARNRMAVIAGIVLIALYAVTVFAGFFAPYGVQNGDSSLTFAPPMRMRIVDRTTGSLVRPFIYPLEGSRDPQTFQLEYVEDRTRRVPIRFFVVGDEYKILGVFTWDRHLFGTGNDTDRVYLFGADQRGRDLFSRVIYGGQVSLSVGIIGVTLTVMLGAVIGTLSGYFGGAFDNITQRSIETLQTFPQLPLWMALSAAIPPSWPPERVYVGIVMVLAFVNWTGLAREARGLVLSLKERDFVAAVEASGGSTMRIVGRHMIPNMMSHIIVTATLAVPITILAESALSFLGIGVRPPMVSWGLLLNDAIKIQNIALYPWLLFPAAFIILAVMAYNFLGDGLRDMVDPFSR